AVNGAFDAIAGVQRRMSFHEEGSDLGRLRRAAPGATVEVAPETVDVLRLALDLYRRSDGLFDVTIGRELVRDGFLPRPRGARFHAYAASSSDIEIVDERNIRCRRPPLADLG